VADSDQRELHISVGCALENLLIAAEHFGYGHQVAYFPEPANEELIAQSNSCYMAKHPPSEKTCYSTQFLPGTPTAKLEIKRKVDELIIRGDANQFSDPAYREEFGYWLGHGAFGASWLIAKMEQLAVTYMNIGKGQAKKDSEVLMSAPVLAALSSKVNA